MNLFQMISSLKQRGLLIAVEGCDRGGKTTQCKLLQEHIRTLGQPCEYIKFPDRTTPIGQLINNYLSNVTDGSATLNDQAVHLLFSANRWELAGHIQELLNSGTSIILDRYVHSGAAYTAAKGLDLNWCRLPDTGLPAPDLVIFIDVPSEESTSRDGYGEERYERAAFQKLVREMFEQLRDQSWLMINGVGAIEQVTERIKNGLFKEKSLKDLAAEPLRLIN